MRAVGAGRRVVEDLQRRWQLTLETPWSDTGASWVARAVRRDGSRVVLKLGLPHMEAADEIAGLQFWDGEPTVRVFESDTSLNALLLERCEPGTPLRDRPEAEQDVVLAGLLRRLWRRPSPPHRFRPLSVMLWWWAEEALAARAHWIDAGLVHAGLRLFEELGRPSPDDALLATDLHAGNVLRAPWLAIDPKPFVGDRAYGATQHLLNCPERMSVAPRDTIRRFADLLEVDGERVRLWMFARSAAGARDASNEASHAVARVLA